MFGKRKAQKEIRETMTAADQVLTEGPVIAPREDVALIAVIAAAIAASLGTSANGIVIRSLKRSRTSTPKWGVAGREQQIYHQF